MPPKNILVIRFSAMGDVMLLVPVLKSLTHAYPEINITVVTRPRFVAFFADIPGVKVFGADVDKSYRGLPGMFALARKILSLHKFELVFDLHDHMRTMILRSFLWISGKKVPVFKKGRREKKEFVRKHNKVIRKLPHTVERYREVFIRAGYDFDILPGPYISAAADAKKSLNLWLESLGIVPKRKKWIGIAPFANHLSKVWPGEYTEQLVERLSANESLHFFFFGGGKEEIEFFESVRSRFPDHCTRVAGVLKIEEEVALLHHIDLMVCVDSSNMHLAVLSGTPLLALWGGTHPDVGFGPWQYDPSVVLQISREELPCRPCSVYGKETCLRKDFACLYRLTPELVSKEISRRLAL